MPAPEPWAGRWALAFVKALRQDPEAVAQGLALLKIICPVIGSIRASGGRGEPSGRAAADQLEGMLRAALKEAVPEGAGLSGPPGSGSPAGIGRDPGGELNAEEAALRFLLLLVKRGIFGQAGKIIERIGIELDNLRGFLRAGLDSPFPPEEDLKKDLEKQLAGKTGAKGVVFEVKIVPELLGGYRLRIGGGIIDASLRALLKQMETDLAAPYAAGAGGALNGVLPSRGGL
ncbi:MAG: F0F1 ATP synthase subunit delta [Treponema sp.]|nr:F0F1 ATP synthase subunit delta [Treponema sp.]